MMTDRAKRICDEVGVSREEAIFYLEGFEWEEKAAMEACRSQTLELPSITIESPAKEKSTMKTDSLQSSNQPEERSRNELIIQFCNGPVVADVQEATSYLECNNWDLQRAMSKFIDDRLPTPSQRKLNRKLGRSYSQPFSGDDDTSVAATLMSMREEQTPKAGPRLVSSQLKIQESTSPVQTREEKHSPVKESAEAPPSSVSSSQLTNSSEKLSQSQEESIKSFSAVATQASRNAAIACLKLCKWNHVYAIDYFFGHCTEAIPEIATAEAGDNLKGKPVDEDSSTKSLETRPLMASSQEKLQESISPFQTSEEKLSLVKESAEAPPSSVSSSEQPSQSQEESIKSFRELAIGASRIAAIACLKFSKWNIDDAIDYFYGDYTEAIPASATAEVDENLKGKADDEESSTKSQSPTQTREEDLSLVMESADVAPPMVIDSRKSSNQLQNSPEQPSRLQLIESFVQVVGGGVTRDHARVYLTICNWDINKAIDCLMDEDSHAFLEKKTSQVHASYGSRNQVNLEEGETRSSSSSSNADPTETGNVTVAIPGTASSQVDEHLKDKAVDEDSSTELSDDTAIELEIWLANGDSGTQVWIPVRSNETIRDIRERVEAFRPENNRDYYFKSDTGAEYRDLNTTVDIITSGSRGSTTLHQLYST